MRRVMKTAATIFTLPTLMTLIQQIHDKLIPDSGNQNKMVKYCASNKNK